MSERSKEITTRYSDRTMTRLKAWLLKTIPSQHIGRHIVYTILNENLKIRKVCTGWLPRAIVNDHKAAGVVVIAVACLAAATSWKWYWFPAFITRALHESGSTTNSIFLVYILGYILNSTHPRERDRTTYNYRTAILVNLDGVSILHVKFSIPYSSSGIQGNHRVKSLNSQITDK